MSMFNMDEMLNEPLRPIKNVDEMSQWELSLRSANNKLITALTDRHLQKIALEDAQMYIKAAIEYANTDLERITAQQVAKVIDDIDCELQ